MNDTHEARYVRNMAQGNGFPRIHWHVRILALTHCGTRRVEHLDIIIAALGLSNGISPLFIHKGGDMSIDLLRALEQVVAREAEEHLCVDRVCAHERFVVGQRVRRFCDDVCAGLAQRGVRARGAGGAGQAEEV